MSDLRTLVVPILLTVTGLSHAASEPWDEEFAPPPGKYSWVQLDTGEWLKGDITALYDDVLIFDSDHFDDINIDLEDIEQIRAVGRFQVSVGDRSRGARRTITGEMVLKGDTIRVILFSSSLRPVTLKSMLPARRPPSTASKYWHSPPHKRSINMWWQYFPLSSDSLCPVMISAD